MPSRVNTGTKGPQQREILYGISGFFLDFHVVYGIYREITEIIYGISISLDRYRIIDTKQIIIYDMIHDIKSPTVSI